MNILILTEFYLSHKNETLVSDYVAALRRNGNQVKIICCASQIKSSDVKILNLHFNLNYKDIVLNKWYNYFYKLFLVVFKKSFNSYLFRKNYGILIENNKSENYIPELILQFTCGAYEKYLFELSNKFSQHYKVPYFIHSFDPIPSTPEWGEKSFLRKSVIKLLLPYFKSAKRVSSVSPRMINHFMKTYDLRPANLYTLHIPINPQMQQTNRSSSLSFLYLGSIYGKRDPKPMLSAFNSLIASNPNVELVFAGSKLNKEELLRDYDNLRKGLRFIDWTDNPDNLINECTVLIDLNADITDDVFISSKLMRYLGFDKPILVIGNKKSASYDFSTKFNGTYFTSNNSSQISFTLNKILEEAVFEVNRSEQIKQFAVETLMENYLNFNIPNHEL